MDKVNLPISNDYCPQTLFCYGTFREDGQPDFGLFCWLSYCWLDKLGVMAAIGGPKLTLDRIHATRVFSANLVTEELRRWPITLARQTAIRLIRWIYRLSGSAARSWTCRC